MLGRTVGHYLVLERIGAGGMGEVYRARDSRLERDVALKVLPPAAVGDEEARRRLRREALALSRLNHPNVAAVYDFDTQDGVDFIAMELLAGETLATRLERGPLTEAESVRFALHIADALEAAHSAGVIHRDLKPGNLFLTARGDLKVLDFGLAKEIRAGPTSELSGTASMLTQPRQILGTLAYMPPEQIRGEALDARADLYSLGAVVYEMVTGQAPFKENSAIALAGMILKQAPSPPRRHRPRISAELESVILRCLEKQPAKRFESAGELRAALRTCSAPGVWPALRRLRPALTATLAVAVVLAGVVVLAFDVGGMRSGLLPGGTKSLAVLPLKNLSPDPDQDYFAEGLTEELISLLGNVGAIRVISRESAMRFRGTSKDLPRIARELHVDHLVIGSVQRVQDQVRIHVRLVKARDERQLWSNHYDAPLVDILGLQSRIAQAVARNLRAVVTRGEQNRLESGRSISPAGHEAYLRGRYHFARGTEVDVRRALAFFEEAVRLDPANATAQLGVADAYGYLSSIAMMPDEAMPRVRGAASRALELDSTLAEAHATLGYALAFFDWRWAEGEARIRRAIELKPGYSLAHFYLGYLLTVNGRFAESSREMRLAWELDPLSPIMTTAQLWPLRHARKHDDEVIAMARRQIDVQPENFGTHLILGQVLVGQGEFETGLAELHAANRLMPNPFIQAWLAYAHAAAGHRDSAQVIRTHLEEQARRSFVQAYVMAILYVGMNERDLALDWLGKGIEQRSEEMATVNVDPALDPLRSDPRFTDIVRQVGLTP